MPTQLKTVDTTPYLLYDNAYAQRLAQLTGNPTVDAISKIALSMRTGQGAEAYTNALMQANAAAAADNKDERQADMAKAYMTYLPTATPKGVGGAVSIGNNPYLAVNPDAVGRADAFGLNSSQASTAKDYSEAAKNVSEAGYGLNAATVGQMLTPPIQETPVPIQEGYLTPTNKAKLIEADASMTTAKAKDYDVRVNTPKSIAAGVARGNGGGNDGIKVQRTFIPNLSQPGTYVEGQMIVTDPNGSIPTTNAASAVNTKDKFIKGPGGTVVRNPNYTGK